MTTETQLLKIRLVVVSACAALLLLILALMALYYPSSKSRLLEVATVDSYQSLNNELASCIDHALRVTETKKPSFSSLEQFWRLCQNQMYDQLLLNDFTIRRAKFMQNSLDERVNLWLVVAITLSGVALSAIQLFMSYRLASTAKTELSGNSELLVEQGKLSMKSAYVGLLMMALSLIFFGIYVKWIYLTFDVETSKPANLTTPAPSGTLLDVPGKLGWPEDDTSKAHQPNADAQPKNSGRPPADQK